jgi:hypothetical protein
MSLAFIDVFLAEQHQAMLILQEILSDTFAIVFVGHFLKLTKTFLHMFWSFLRGLFVLIAQFSPFHSQAAFL